MHKFEPLSRGHDREGFDCGVPALNQFLRQSARQAQDKGLSRTFVAVGEGTEDPKEIFGFFTLSATEAETATLPAELAKKFPPKIPAVILARLAVAVRHQSKGFGSSLVAEALVRIAEIADKLGIAGALVDAKDDRAASFYARFGFIPLPSDPLRLFMPLDRIKTFL